MAGWVCEGCLGSAQIAAGEEWRCFVWVEEEQEQQRLSSAQVEALLLRSEVENQLESLLACRGYLFRLEALALRYLSR